MKQRLILSLTFLLFACLSIRAQVTIGDSTPPQKFSVLEVVSNAQGGLRLPHLTTQQRDALSATQEFAGEDHRGGASVSPGLGLGLTIYNTDTNCTEYWNGYKWVSLCLGTADIGLPGYPAAEVPASGGEAGVFTPEETPKCTTQNPPYSIALMAGAQFASAYFLNESTGQFSVSFSENTTARQRTVIVRLTNNCTGEYKEFVFSQAGNSGLCNPAVSKPLIVAAATNANGNAVICGDMGGGVILGISNPDPAAEYIWVVNDIQEAGRGKYIVARQTGSYKVYVGGIGCDDNVSDPIIVERNGLGSPQTQPQVMADNGAVICGGAAVTITIQQFSSVTGTVRWYKDGLLYGTGQSITTTTAGAFVAVADDGGCHSEPSEAITVTVKAGTPVTFSKSDIEINGINLGSGTPVFCSGGWLQMKISNTTAGYVYRWYMNGVNVGTGTTCDYQLPGSVGSDVNLSIVAESGAAGSCPMAITIDSTIGADLPLDATISGPNSFCNNVPGGAQLSTSGGGASYLWKNLTTSVNANTYTTSSFGATTAGEYKVEITSQAGCLSISPKVHKVEMTGSPLPAWEIQATVVGDGETATYKVTNNGSPVTEGYTWTATNISGTASATVAPTTANQASITFAGGGAVRLSVVGEGYCGKSSPLTLDVTVNQDKPATPVITIPPAVNVCGGWQFSLTDAIIAVYDAAYGTNGWRIQWDMTTSGGSVGAMQISGSNNRFCYVAFTSSILTTISMKATCIAGGASSDASIIETVTGNAGAAQTYTLTGQKCFDIKVTDWTLPANGGTQNCGQWDRREQADFGLWYTYKLAGMLLPSNASDITWSLVDPDKLVESTDYSTLNEAKLKFYNHRVNEAIIGNKIGLNVTLRVAFKVTNGGCLSTYQKDIVINIRDCDCCTTVTDIEGNTYTAHRFGDAGCWMTEHLAVTKMPDGTAITLGTTGYLIPGGDANATKALPRANGGLSYGMHYTWAIASGGMASDNNSGGSESVKSAVQGVCPDGWVLPSDYEWNMLEKEIYTNASQYSSNSNSSNGAWLVNYETMSSYRPSSGYQNPGWWGESMKSSRSIVGLPAPNGKSNTDGTGFDVVLSGFDGSSLGGYAYFWLSSTINNYPVRRGLYQPYSCVYRSGHHIASLFIVRCKKKE